MESSVGGLGWRWEVVIRQRQQAVRGKHRVVPQDADVTARDENFLAIKEQSVTLMDWRARNPPHPP